MKTYIRISVLSVIMVVLAVFYSNSQEKQSANKTTTLKILTSAQCDMCKERIEKAINKLSGIISADLNYETKYLTVEFNPEETSDADIRKTLNRTGYDADSTKAEMRAYNKLPKCCKKPEGR
jgi:periplasmic mercuric ion binding protein